MSERLDHLDDPRPPRVGDAEHAAAIIRGRALRRRRRTTWAGSFGGAVTVAVVVALLATGTGGAPVADHLASSDGLPTPAESVVDESVSPSPEPSTSAPTSVTEPDPPDRTAAAGPHVRPVLAPQPVRPKVTPPACTPAQEAALMPPTVPMPEGMQVTGFYPEPGQATITEGEEWTTYLAVHNWGSTPFTFTEVAPVLGFAADMGVHPDNARPIGGDPDSNTETKTYTVPPQKGIQVPVRISSMSCTAGQPLPYASYRLYGLLRTDKGNWKADMYPGGWVVARDGGGCFAEPELQDVPPIDGLKLSAGASPVGGKDDFLFPDSSPYADITLTNTTGRDITLVQHGPPLAYFLRDGKVTGGWLPPGNNEPTPEPIKVYAHESFTFHAMTFAAGCIEGQPQTPGMRDVVVALLVERDGVRYHWKGRGSAVIRWRGGYEE